MLEHQAAINLNKVFLRLFHMAEAMDTTYNTEGAHEVLALDSNTTRFWNVKKLHIKLAAPQS